MVSDNFAFPQDDYFQNVQSGGEIHFNLNASTTHDNMPYNPKYEASALGTHSSTLATIPEDGPPPIERVPPLPVLCFLLLG